MQKRFWILCLVTTLLCLGGCDRDTPVKTAETEENAKEYYVFDPAVTWELRPLVTGDGVPLWDNVGETNYARVDYAVTEDGVTWLYQELLYDEIGAVTGFVTHTETFGWDGAGHGRQAHPWKGTGMMPSIRTAWEPMGDGTFLLSEFTGSYQNPGYRLVQYDGEGTVLAEYTMPENAGRNAMSVRTPAMAVSDTMVSFSIGNWMCILDRNLQPVLEQSISREITELFFAGDGTLYGQDWNGMLVRIDKNGNLSEVKPDARREMFHQIYIGGDTLFCCAEKDGIFAFADAGAEGALMLDWASSGILWQNTDILQAVGEDCLFIRTADNMEIAYQYAMLVRREDAGQIQKEHVSVVMPWMGTRINAAEMAAVQFNRTSEQYHVTVEAIDIDAQNSYEKILFQRMEAGQSPDIVLFENFLEDTYLNLERQGYLADLSAYGLADRLTGSAKGAVSHGDALYRIPYTIQYQTLARTDGKDTVTAAELTQRGTAGEVLFSDPSVLISLRTGIQTLFIDPVSGTCTLDSPAFAEYLHFYRQLETCIDSETGYLSATNYDGRMTSYTFTAAGVPDKLRSGEIPFMQVPVSSIAIFPYLEVIYGDTDYTLCGYPELTMLVSSMQSAAVLESGKNPEGAAAFLSFLLSETVQAAAMITDTSVPVTWEGVDAALAHNWWYCGLSESFGGGGTLITWYKTPEQRKLESYEKHYREIHITDEVRTRIRQMLDDPATARFADPAIEEMIHEEIQVFLTGDRNAEETAKVLQSRVGTYLAENKK
ncbi:MAG: extracellular solute-binding protein [Clostridia bacterium]|nr:extracellular solute-binding protein [Clostridia bacterium]